MRPYYNKVLLYLFAISSVLLISSQISKAQPTEDGTRIKARADNAQLTTSEREQHLLRRLQTRGFSSVPDPENVRFDPDVKDLAKNEQIGEQEYIEDSIEQKVPSRKPLSNQNPTVDLEDAVTTGKGQNSDDDTKPTSRLNSPSEIQENELKSLLDSDRDGSNALAPDDEDPEAMRQGEGQDKSKKEAQERSIQERIDLRTNRQAEAKDPTQLRPRAGVRPKEQRDWQSNDMLRDSHPELKSDLDDYESMEESAETAHISRGTLSNRANEGLNKTAEQTRREKHLSGPTHLPSNQGLEKQTDPNQVVEQQDAQNKIKQLEMINENLKLQKDIATAQAEITNLTNQLSQSQRQLSSAERQVSELSKRLQHVGDRRRFGSDILAPDNSRLKEISSDDQYRDNPNNSFSTSGGRETTRDQDRYPDQVEDNLDQRMREVDRRAIDRTSATSSRQVETLEGGLETESMVEIPRQTESYSNAPLAVVNADNSQLHSGPDQSYPSVMRLRKGEKVVIEEQSSEWLQVIAPNGARAWIQRQDTNYDALIRGERSSLAPQPSSRRGNGNVQRSAEDRALDLIRRGGSRR